MSRKPATNAAHLLRAEMGYITEADVADVMSITVPTLRNRQSSGSAPPVYKIGRLKLYRRDEFQAWINRRRRASVA